MASSNNQHGSIVYDEKMLGGSSLKQQKYLSRFKHKSCTSLQYVNEVMNRCQPCHKHGMWKSTTDECLKSILARFSMKTMHNLILKKTTNVTNAPHRDLCKPAELPTKIKATPTIREYQI